MIKFRSYRKKSLVNLTPMVSVIFLLIIFFLVSGTIRSPAFSEIKLAESESKDEIIDDIFIVYLNKDGELSYEQQKIDYEQLKSKLTNKNSSAVIQVHADHRVNTQMLIKLLDILQSTFISKITLITQAKN